MCAYGNGKIKDVPFDAASRMESKGAEGRLQLSFCNVLPGKFVERCNWEIQLEEPERLRGLSNECISSENHIYMNYVTAGLSKDARFVLCFSASLHAK